LTVWRHDRVTSWLVAEGNPWFPALGSTSHYSLNDCFLSVLLSQQFDMLLLLIVWHWRETLMQPVHDVLFVLQHIYFCFLSLWLFVQGLVWLKPARTAGTVQALYLHLVSTITLPLFRSRSSVVLFSNSIVTKKIRNKIPFRLSRKRQNIGRCLSSVETG